MVENHHKLNFCRATRVKRVASFELLGDGYSFIPYSDILAGQLNTDVAFDVVGQVIQIGDMKILMQDGRQTKMLTFVLQDVDGTKLDCALWGEFAAQVNTFVEKNSSFDEPTLVFIQLAKAKFWQGNVQVSNSFFGTKVYINNDIQPIVEFRKKIHVSMDSEQNQIQFVALVGTGHRETFVFILPNRFRNALVDGNMLNTRVSAYQGVYNVDITYGSSGGQLLLKGNGWRDLIVESFGNRLMFLHLMKCEGESLYVIGYDTRGIEITGEANESNKTKTNVVCW